MRKALNNIDPVKLPKYGSKGDFFPWELYIA
jgi:hypothetical protein